VQTVEALSEFRIHLGPLSQQLFPPIHATTPYGGGVTTMTDRAGRSTTGLITVLAIVIVGVGVWYANRSDGNEVEPSAANEPPPASGPVATSDPLPAETMLVVTLPGTTTTTLPTPPTTLAVATSPTTTEPAPPPYRTATQQIDYYITGPERQRVIGDLQTLTPFVVSVDQLDARHPDPNEVRFQIDEDAAPRLIGPAVVVSLTSDFGGDDAVAEEAWIVTKYFASMWAEGEPVRIELDGAGPMADDVNTHVGYSLEVNIGRRAYTTTGPTMAAIADVRLGFDEWERIAKG